MQTQLETLARATELVKELDYVFYTVGVRSYGEIILQGNFNADLMRKLKEKGYTVDVNSCGFIVAKKDEISVTLT